jgi:hypothetical protein
LYTTATHPILPDEGKPTTPLLFLPTAKLDRLLDFCLRDLEEDNFGGGGDKI